MSSPMSGVIQAIIARETRAGVFYDVQVNGKKYGHGKFPPRDVKEGDFVTFEVDVKQNGQYTNYDIKRGTLRRDDGSAEKIAQAESYKPAAPRMEGGGKREYVPFDERQQIISTQAAVNTALEFCSLCASQSVLPALGTAKAADKLSLMRQWVLDEAGRFYKVSTGRDLDLPVTEELVEGMVQKTRAPAKPKPAAEPEPADEGYDEYPSE